MAHAAHRPVPPHFLHTTHSGERKVAYDFYQGIGAHAGSDVLIVLLNGWLGSGTMRYAAREAAWRGFDTVAPLHGGKSLGRFLAPNKFRSQNIHSSIVDASIRTGKRDVVLIDHSNGHQDALQVAMHTRRLGDKPPYNIRAIGAIAGVNTNGKHPDMLELQKELLNAAKLLRDHPLNQARLLGHSALNLVKHPIISLQEGVGAVLTDCGPLVEELVREGHVGVSEIAFMENDFVIPKPDGFEGIVYPGSHLSPVVADPSIFVDMTERLAA